MSRHDIEERSARDRALFDKIASDYARKDNYGPSMAARRARLFHTIDSVSPNPDFDLLEIGCGAGYAARYLQGRYRSYTGIDHSDDLIQVAIAENRLSSTEFHAADLYHWKPTRSFDVVFAIGVLHHLPDIPSAMGIMRSVLKPGGFVVVNEPQPANRLFHRLRKIRAFVDSSYSVDQEELEEETLINVFESAGLRHVAALPQGLFSTPFAEVMLKPAILTGRLSAFACGTDRFLERSFPDKLKRFSWNLIVKGQYEG
jgi:SAM-dependent methyltransferase